MEIEIRERFNDSILEEAQRRYEIDAANIRLLDSFESFIYAYSLNGSDYILRIGHSRRRSPELIHGEVDWINYLAAGGAGVARAVHSQRGALVEVIPDGRGGSFLATAFVKARGKAMSGWTDELIDDYGRLLGRIHALSKDYTVSDPAWRRPSWDDPVFATLPPVEAPIADRFASVLSHLRALPRDRQGYGMIHQDAHGGNFFVDENGQITLFDFDDCTYGHFANDLAMALFYAAANRDDTASFAPRFWRLMLRGYAAENELDPAWLREVPWFMKLREIDLYGIITRDFDSLDGDGWAQQFMIGRKERILQDRPFLEMGF